VSLEKEKKKKKKKCGLIFQKKQKLVRCLQDDEVDGL
jgi:hypothetical protein